MTADNHTANNYYFLYEFYIFIVLKKSLSNFQLLDMNKNFRIYKSL